MSTAAGTPSSNGANAGLKSPQSKDKGKAKSSVASPDVSMEEDEDEDEEEDEEDEDEDEDMEEVDDNSDGDEDEEENYHNPDEILPQGRRTRGNKVDYTSDEALRKAGLTREEMKKDDDN